ncbi:MAG: ABC transporter substrate-binding protein, partial [Firmicutes bacterium]|nr:ABC transporter substrate-binding protein [Bacillota bacterium]
MKKVLFLLMLAVTAFTLTACSDSNDSPDSGTIVIWSSGEELQRFVEGFNEIYPNIEVVITVVPNSEFVSKLTPALASGVDAPDLFTGESDYVKYLLETPFWDDLSNYGVEEYTSDMWNYVLSGGTDSNGVIKALSWQASPGSVMYRRDIALEVFGTDEPDDISQLLYSNEKMMQTAATLKASGYKMF